MSAVGCRPAPWQWGSLTPRMSVSGEARVSGSMLPDSVRKSVVHDEVICAGFSSASSRPSRPASYALGRAPYKVLRYAPTARVAPGSRLSLQFGRSTASGEPETLTAPHPSAADLAIT